MIGIRRLAVVLATLGLIAGCGGPKLAPTPNLFLHAPYDPFTDVSPSLQSSDVTLYYATDRAPIESADGELAYGYGRSRSLAIGTAVVSIGEDVSWDALVAESLARRRSMRLRLRVHAIDELARGPDVVTRFVEIGGERVPDPAMAAVREQVTDRVSELLAERLAGSERKELFVFVHGFNNTFDQACDRMAQLWHFMGRVGVPVVFTWPAGHPGLLRGYQYDRESGEFAVYHLRETIRLLATCPDVEKIHIIAHSRGTDVAMSALRELHIGAKGAGVDTRTEFKLGTVVLAAADLDFDVVATRIGADGLHIVPEQLVMYLSEDDRAIGIATWLFDSMRRLGRLTMSDLSKESRASIALFPEIQFIDVEVEADWLGHGYFISNPAVLSDMILVLRDNARPGAEHGRPLEGGGEEFWRLRSGYPRFEPPLRPEAEPAFDP